MNQSIIKKTASFTFVILLILIASGLVLLPVVTNKYVLFVVFAFVFIAMLSMVIFTINVYIKPIRKVSETMDKLLEGNYHARIQGTAKGTVGELSDKINALARSLSELTIQEQIQSEQLSTVIENSESGLVLIDEKGYIHLVNRKFISMFGKTPQDYIGYLYYDVLENEQIHHTVQKTFLSEEHVKQMFSIENNGSPAMYLEIVGAPIFNERNILRGAVLVIYDITEFKHIETMRRDFVANVSHELKTPITSIRGFSETLLDGAQENQEIREQFLQIIFKESKRIQLLIDDLLILSKIEKDEPQLSITECNTKDLIAEVLPLFHQRSEQKKIHLEIDDGESMFFEADGEKVKQVLLNLFTNAINYTPELGKVKISINDAGDNVLFEVKDTGIGIEKEVLPRIFERFYRVDKDRSRKTGGTGLGLAIVKHIVEAHHGSIVVSSEINVGTTFKVYFPKKSPLLLKERAPQG